MKIEKNKQFDEVTFRLFWDDKPVGFENWNIFSPLCNYTYGDPTKVDGYKGSGWSGTRINFNSKELVDIHYIEPKPKKKVMVVGRIYKISTIGIQPNNTICRCIEDKGGGYYIIKFIYDLESNLDKQLNGIGGWLIDINKIYFEELGYCRECGSIIDYDVEGNELSHDCYY